MATSWLVVNTVDIYLAVRLFHYEQDDKHPPASPGLLEVCIELLIRMPLVFSVSRQEIWMCADDRWRYCLQE